MAGVNSVQSQRAFCAKYEEDLLMDSLEHINTHGVLKTYEMLPMFKTIRSL